MSTKFDSTYSAVLSLAEQFVGEGKYDSTYSAVLAIYQNLTSDVDTKFDSVYSIVVNISEGIENGSINIGGGGSGIILEKLIKTINSNGTYQFKPSNGKCYSQVDITVDVEIPEFTTETLTETLTTNGTYNYTPTTDGYNQVDITVDVDIPEFTTESLTETLTTNGTYNYTPTTDGYNKVDITVDVDIPEFTTESLTETLTTNGTYNYTPTTDGYNQVDITVDVEIPEFTTETLTKTITTNGTYNYTPTTDGYSQVDITVDVDIPEFTTETLTKTITTNGTYNYTPTTDGYSQVDIIVDVEGGGSDNNNEQDFSPKIRFFDYEGNMVEEWDFETAKTKTELPAFTDTDLLNQTGWNADFDDINWVIEHNTDLAVGALYRPNDNKTHIVVDIKPENLNTVLFIQTLDGFEIDWGDGTVEDVDTINGYPQHTYDSPGSKDIKISGNWNPQWGVSSISQTTKTYNGFPNSYYLQQITNIHCGIKLGYYWFKYLGNLKYLTFVEDEVVYNTSYFDFTYCDKLKIISLPKGSGKIDLKKLVNHNIEVICNPVDLNVGNSFNFSSSFQVYNPQLKYLNIPDGVTSIGNNAFYNCYSLQSVNIPDGVTSIGSSAFYNCYSLQSINIPDGVTSIGDNGFQYCSSLQSINIPDGVTSIGRQVFRDCPSLQSITIPDSVTNINSQVFYNCYSLQSINIPDSITSIDIGAFQQCYSLQSITIPDSVTSINSAFNSCSYLTLDFTNNTQIPRLSSSSNVVDSTALILVPESLYDEWISATNWSSLSSQIIAI